MSKLTKIEFIPALAPSTVAADRNREFVASCTVEHIGVNERRASQLIMPTFRSIKENYTDMLVTVVQSHKRQRTAEQRARQLDRTNYIKGPSLGKTQPVHSGKKKK